MDDSVLHGYKAHLLDDKDQVATRVLAVSGVGVSASRAIVARGEYVGDD